MTTRNQIDMNKSFIVVCLVLFGLNVFAQDAITVEGEVTKPLKISLADMGRYPVQEVKAKDKDGKEHVFKGTLLTNVLGAAGVTLGKDLRGENLVKYVIVKAVDGYEVVYSLAEVDPEFSMGQVLLTTHVDGNLLAKDEGVFRLVNTGDRRPTRWVRQVVEIRVVFAR